MTYAVTKDGRLVPSHTTDDSVYLTLKRTLESWSTHGQRRLAWAVVAEALFGQPLIDVQEATDAGGNRVVTFTLRRRGRG